MLRETPREPSGEMTSDPCELRIRRAPPQDVLASELVDPGVFAAVRPRVSGRCAPGRCYTPVQSRNKPLRVGRGQVADRRQPHTDELVYEIELSPSSRHTERNEQRTNLGSLGAGHERWRFRRRWRRILRVIEEAKGADDVSLSLLRGLRLGCHSPDGEKNGPLEFNRRSRLVIGRSPEFESRDASHAKSLTAASFEWSWSHANRLARMLSAT